MSNAVPWRKAHQWFIINKTNKKNEKWHTSRLSQTRSVERPGASRHGTGRARSSMWPVRGGTKGIEITRVFPGFSCDCHVTRPPVGLLNSPPHTNTQMDPMHAALSSKSPPLTADLLPRYISGVDIRLCWKHINTRARTTHTHTHTYTHTHTHTRTQTHKYAWMNVSPGTFEHACVHANTHSCLLYVEPGRCPQKGSEDSLVFTILRGVLRWGKQDNCWLGGWHVLLLQCVNPRHVC